MLADDVFGAARSADERDENWSRFLTISSDSSGSAQLRSGATKLADRSAAFVEQ